MHVVLAGNPNCGKTTLFNALTGQNQNVGNWPGVTVEQKIGTMHCDTKEFKITDLPGVYSMVSLEGSGSVDEQIATKTIVEWDYDVIINVVDACHLERHLYLSSQLLELGKPVIIVLNMSDLALQQGIRIDETALSKQLACPVISIQAHKKIGLASLQAALMRVTNTVQTSPKITVPTALTSVYEQLLQFFKAQPALAEKASYLALRTLEGDHAYCHEKAVLSKLKQLESDILSADARYNYIHALVSAAQSKQSDTSEHFTARLDGLVLHRFLAIPIFLAVMYCMFLFAINVGGAFQDFFDLSTQALFVDAPTMLLSKLHAPAWFIALLANGVGKGINTTLTFIPVIAAMFFFLAMLEASGYMARAAFVVDRLMRWLGLPGKSFVPMIVGFGCNVPSIMAARTLNDRRDRLLTILMSPFMSCSARLAIYAVFVAAFFPTGGQNVVFSLYIIGIVMAVLTGLMLRKTHLQGQSSPLILELPTYHRPSFIRLWKQMQRRLKFFLIRAGRLIIPVCILLGGLNALMIDGSLGQGDSSSQSVLAWLGQTLTPIFSPMGIHTYNWPATVGLLTGMLAKEVVVGSLNSLYAQMGQFHIASAEHFNLWTALSEALYTIPENLINLGQALWNPVLASAQQSELSQSVYGMMAQKFDGQAGAYAYLLFVLLYVPCVSTMAAIRQEASRRWMWFSITWSILLAYAAAVIFYQAATFAQHPKASMLWCIAMLSAVALFVLAMKYPSFKIIKGAPHASKTA
jgi:ferrous iron transport protein B